MVSTLIDANTKPRNFREADRSGGGGGCVGVVDPGGGGERSVGSPGLWQLQMPADKFPLNSLYSSPPKVQGWQRGGGGFKQSLKFSFPYNVYHWLTKCYILLLVQCSKILSLKWFSRGSAQCKVFCEKFQFHYCKVLKVFSNIFLSLAKINFQKK